MALGWPRGGRTRIGLTGILVDDQDRAEKFDTEVLGLKAKGVVFVREPARMAYGGMDGVFDDTCGNLVNLHQD